MTDKERFVETPSDPFDLLCLNPGGERAPRNPLCPVCEAEIRPTSNDIERRFVCDCEQVWQFRFDNYETGNQRGVPAMSRSTDDHDPNAPTWEDMLEHEVPEVRILAESILTVEEESR